MKKYGYDYNEALSDIDNKKKLRAAMTKNEKKAGVLVLNLVWISFILALISFFYFHSILFTKIFGFSTAGLGLITQHIRRRARKRISSNY